MYSLKTGYIKFVLICYLTSAFLWQYEAGLIPDQMQENKCCVPAEWEGKMHLSAASELNYFHNLVYTNASIHIAYSVPLQKIYLGMHVYQISLFLPNATFVTDTNVTMLYDFEKVSYCSSGMARWLSGRVSDSGARGPEFEPHDRHVVSLSKTL